MSQPLWAKRLLTILEREPLGYRVARQCGSHRCMEAPGSPPFMFAFHDKATSAKLTSPSNY